MQETPGERRSELLVGSSPSDGTPIQLLPRLVALLLACLISSCTPKEERADAVSAAIPATGGPSSTGAVPLGTARAALVSSVPISAAGDTYLRSGSPNQNAGGDTILSLQSSGNRRALLFFDTPAIVAAVGGGTLVSARLELTIFSTASNWGSGRPISLHRLQRASAEYQATWACALDANVNNQQADCSGESAWDMGSEDPAVMPWSSTATATATITSNQTGVVSFDVTADLAAMLGNSWPGHGWLIKKVNEGDSGAIDFASRERTPAPRLVLEIEEGSPGGGGGPGPIVGSAALPPQADTHIRQGHPNQNYSTESYLRIQASGRNRGLLTFDAAAIGSALGGPLVRARLLMPILKTYPNWGPDRTLGAHRMLRSWVDGVATWSCAADSNIANGNDDCAGNTAWVMWGPGVEVPWLSPPTGTVLVSSEETGTLELDVTRDVACALAGHVPLHGWLIKKAMENQAGKVELYSRESTTPPMLALDWTNTVGVSVTAAECTGTPGGGPGCTPSATLDTTCNGVDEDCDGLADDDFIVAETTCGVGACARAGEQSCVAGQVTDSCAPGSPAPTDSTCDAVDDDCSGEGDEDYVPTATQCGVGVCTAGGISSCVAGQVTSGCTPGAPSGDDANCNGIDEDCDGSTDEGFVPSPTSCQAGACEATGTTTCEQGSVGCTADVLLPVDDGNPCTVDVCVPALGPTHAPVPAGTSCADADVCNGAEACNAAGICVSSGTLDVSDGNPCTLDSCDPALGAQHAPAAAQTPCDDGNVCNGVAVCNGAGVCTPGAPPDLDDGNPCTSDACDPFLGVGHRPAAAGTSCVDADVCNGAESCDGFGSCVPGTPLNLDDQKPCTVDACDPVLGLSHRPGLIEICDDDNDVCNGTAFCNATGECIHDAAPPLDDGDPCTVDYCHPVSGVFHDPRPAGASCDDGNPCNGVAACDELGACTPGTPPSPDDANPCTIDSCFPSTGVFHALAPAGTPCADENPCVGSGTCNEAGACITDAPELDDGDACTADSCDPALGVLHVAIAIADDGDACTIDTCDPELGMQHTSVPEGGPCSDGDACNGEEACFDGECLSFGVGGSDDDNPCTQDLCDADTGTYSHPPEPEGTPCEAEEYCGRAGTCYLGDCMVRGAPIDDGDTCTLDLCDDETGEVQHVLAEAGSACDNGNVCDGVEDGCDTTGACVGNEELEPPPASELCQLYDCDPLLGFVTAPAPRGTPCGLRAICDEAGVCVPGASAECEEQCRISSHCDAEIDYAGCNIQCAYASTGLCSDEMRAHQACVLANATECQPLECETGKLALDACLLDRGNVIVGPPESDCVAIIGASNGEALVEYAPAGTTCEGAHSCGVGFCDEQHRCVVSTGRGTGAFDQPQCITLQGPGYCVTGGGDDQVGQCQPGLAIPSPCYNTELDAVLPHGTPCRLGVCSEEGICDRFGRCLAEPKPGGTPCEDKSLCGGPGKCGQPQPNLQFERDHSFECIPDAAPQLDTDDPCAYEECNPTTGALERHPQPAGVSCDDNNPCNGLSEVCDGSGLCQATYEIPVDDGDPCTIDYACDPVDGFVKEVAPDGTSCSDGDPCNGEELCLAGVCGTGPVQPVDPCFVRTCDSQVGVVEVPAPAGTVCELSPSPCLENALCDGAGHCMALAPVVVDDHDACTVDSCSDQGVQHVYYLPEDGNVCTVAECDPIEGPVQLPVSAGTSCSDGNACNGEEACDGFGVCASGTPLLVEDSNPCTLDRCDPAEGVVHEPEPGGVSCSDGDACNGEELCNGSGQCSPGVPPPVDDGLACTDDSCDADRGITHTWVGGVDCEGPTWTTLTASAPSPRDSSAAIFVPVTSELFLFGGENAGVPLADAWLFDASTKSWRVSSATPPPARAGAVAVYDELSERVLVFGGVSGTASGASYFSDVWEYDPTLDEWSEIEISGDGPEERALAAASYDSERDVVVVFGGVGSDGTFGDTWELDATAGTWTARATEGPSPRGGAAMAYDPIRHRMVLLGGASQSSGMPGAPLADLWELDSNTGVWVQRSTTNAPPARTGHGLIYDSARQRFRLFGGTGAQPEAFSDAWELDSSAGVWQPLAPTFNLPGRAGHAIGYDPLTGSTLVAAGLAYSDSGLVTPATADVWRLDASGTVWREISGRVAPLRTGCPELCESEARGLVFDHARSALVSVGPLPATNRMVAWEFSSSNDLWEARELVSQPDLFRYAPRFETLAYDLDRHRTLIGARLRVFDDGREALASIWEWDGSQVTRGCDFPQLPSGSSVLYDPVRRRLTSIGRGDFGGYTTGEVWQLDLASCQVRAGRGAPAIGSALSVWDSQRGRVILHGGYYGYSGRSSSDTWLSDTALQSWRMLPSGGARPIAEPFQAGMAYDPVGAKVVWFGNRFTPQTWVLDTQSEQWQLIADATGPRLPASLSFDASRGNVVLLDGSGDLWDFTGNAWRRRELFLTPPARNGAAAAWVPQTGYGVLFGGVSGSGQRRLLGDTWIWSNGWKPASDLGSNDAPRRWDPPAPLSPPARTGHAFAAGLESEAPEVSGVLMGGEGETGLLGDVWAFNRATYEWTPLERCSMFPRTGHAMAALPELGYVLFGGQGANGLLNDTVIIRFNGSSESCSSDSRAAAALPPRWGHAMAGDPERGTLLLFGGRNADTVFGDTWEYRPNAEPRWVRHEPRMFPPARFGHALVYDPMRQRIVLTGGSGTASGSTFDDTWDWNAAEGTWIRRTPERSLPARAGHAAFFDATRGELIAFGGLAYADGGRAASTFGDTLALQNASTTVDETIHLPNGARCAHPEECDSGSCVDGFCCNSSCTGQCGACDVPGEEGRCVAVLGPPHGARSPCEGVDQCQQCGGRALDACGAADGLTCGVSGCSNGSIYTIGECSDGSCTNAFSQSCAPYACSTKTNTCLTKCNNHADCYPDEAFCWLPGYLGLCTKYARVREVTVPPEIHVGTSVTLLAWANQGPVDFTFSYQQPGGGWFAACPRKYTDRGECRFMPNEAGTTLWRVEVAASASPKLVDDSQQFQVTVLP